MAAAAVAAGANASMGEDEELVGEDAKLGIRKGARPRAAMQIAGDTTHTVRSDVSRDAPIPRPPFYGSRVVGRSRSMIFAFINETALFKGQWQFKKGRSPTRIPASSPTMCRNVYEKLQSARNRRTMTPRVSMVLPCQSAGMT